jgi:3-deoxy-D-manno-octulosonic-acid transferase
MSPATVRTLYNLALPPALLAALPSQWLKLRRRGGTTRDLAERLGHFPTPTATRFAALTKPWWIHAVSVGEVLVATKAIHALRVLRPEIPVVLSTTTTTGHAVARSEVPADVPVIYNPIDLPGAVRRAFDAIRPGRLILVEAEVWPNLLHIAHEWGLEVALINARLSPRSERRYQSARRLVAPLLGQLDLVLVPEPEDVARWSAIGVRPDVIGVTGSLKHDYEGLPDDPRTTALAEIMRSLWPGAAAPTLLAASTHPGEEALLASVFRDLRAGIPGLRLLLAPRHVERSAAVAAELTALGLHVVRRSTLGTPPATTAPPAAPDVLLIDTTGELRAWQPLADAVVIGKSFLTTGGQNPVEALMAGRPVVTGPHMENFGPLMRTLLDHRAIIQVTDAAALRPALHPLLTCPEHAAGVTAAARTALAPHQGAARRTAERLLRNC